MPFQFDSKKSLQQKIESGVDVLADYVASTLGPRGRTVILQQKDKRPIMTKDGVTVAKFINLEDSFENLGAQIIKQASERTATDAGDGTTTTTVLARAIYKNAQKYIQAGISPVELKRGMDKACEKIVENLKEKSIPISSLEDIERVATISANGDKQIGKLISQAVEQAGRDGAITIEEGNSLETTLDVIEGFQIDSGYCASAFITDERRGAVKHDNAFVFVTDYKLENVEELLPLLETVARDGRPLVIVAEAVEGQALAALIMNSVRGSMKILAVKAPRYGQERRKIMQDLAISTGATFLTRESGVSMREVKLEHLGMVKSVDCLKNVTTFMGGKGDSDEIDKRIDSLNEEIKQTDDIHECERIQERITRLASGVSIIRVGGATEVEMIEKKHRIEDALEAVRSAQAEGITAGGGMALIKASKNVKIEADNEEQRIGLQIVLESASAPFKQIAENCGLSPDVCYEKAKRTKDNHGFHFINEKVSNFVEDGIVDPIKVARCALQNAVSAGGTLITSNYAVVEN